MIKFKMPPRLRNVMYSIIGTSSAREALAESRHWNAQGLLSTRHVSEADLPVGAVDSQQPIFLLATSWRSGSTLLQRLVCSNGRYLVWGEPYGHAHLVQAMARSFAPFSGDWPPEHFFPDSINMSELENTWIANLFPSLDDLRAAHLAFFQQLFEQPARRAGFDHWGIKEVRFGAAEARYLRWLFPSARFIIQVRNPWDAYVSYKNCGGDWYDRWPDRPVMSARAFGAHWRRLTEELLGCADEIDAFLITYEQLLSDHDKLTSLSSYLGYKLEAVGGTRRVGSSTHRRGVRNPRYGLNLIDSIQIARQVGDLTKQFQYHSPMSV